MNNKIKTIIRAQVVLKGKVKVVPLEIRTYSCPNKFKSNGKEKIRLGNY